MKLRSFDKNKGTEKDYHQHASFSLSEQCFGFVHGFVFCLILKNISKSYETKGTVIFNSSVNECPDPVVSSQLASVPAYQSCSPCARIKAEQPEIHTGDQESPGDEGCSSSDSTTMPSRKLPVNPTEDDNEICSEDSSVTSFYLPVHGEEESTHTFDDRPSDLSDIKDYQSSTFCEKRRFRKRRLANISAFRDTGKSKQTGQADEVQKSTSKVVHKSKVNITWKSSSNITKKRKTNHTKKQKACSEKTRSDTIRKSGGSISGRHINSNTVAETSVGSTDTVVPVTSQRIACDKCDKTFTTASSYKRHTVKAHLTNGETVGNKLLSEKNVYAQCEKCPKVYTGGRAEKNLHQHVLAYHTEMSPVQCDVCNLTLNNEHHLKLHKRSSHRKDVCHICGAHFVTQIGLQTHLLAHKGDKSFVCEICGAAFVRMSSLRQHTKFHTDSRNFKCGRCPLSFKTFSSLNIHMMCVHQCGSYFSSQVQKLARLGYMVDSESTERLQKAQCVTCGQEVVSTSCPVHASDCLLSFSCPQCQWSTKDIQKFRKHLVKRNSATVCSGTDENKTVKNCSGFSDKSRPLVKNFVCPSCGKQFYTQSHLQAHRHQHAEKRFSCPVCEKSFTYKFNMQNHLTTHSDARPFECQMCQKTFKMKSQLQLHQRYHDGEFKCNICGKVLTRKQHVISHYKLVHPEAQMSK